MNRKIDDELLLDLISQGVTQKAIAAQMHVSPAAICKRVKRLLPGPESTVLDKFSLTEKEKTFVLAKAQGATNTTAALSAYECSSRNSAKVIGTQLMAKQEIRTAVEEMIECGLTMKHRIDRLKFLVDHKDPVIVHKGLDMSFKLDGSYAPEKHEITALTASLEMTEQTYKDLIASKYPERNS